MLERYENIINFIDAVTSVDLRCFSSDEFSLLFTYKLVFLFLNLKLLVQVFKLLLLLEEFSVHVLSRLQLTLDCIDLSLSCFHLLDLDYFWLSG